MTKDDRKKRRPIFSETAANKILDVGTDEDVQSFAKSFLYSRSNRTTDLEAQYAILLRLAADSRVTRDCNVFSAISAGYRACDMQDRSRMNNIRTMINGMYSTIEDFRFSDHLRSDRTHVLWSLLTIDIHLCFFLENKADLHRTLSSAIVQAKGLDFEDLRRPFFLTSANVARVLGFKILMSGGGKREAGDIASLMLKAFVAGIIKREGDDSGSGKLENIVFSDHKAFFEFVKDTQIYPISRLLLVASEPVVREALLLALLRACLRTAGGLTDDELKAKAARVFPDWPVARP